MLLPELLRETLDTANLECWERERTANARLGVGRSAPRDRLFA